MAVRINSRPSARKRASSRTVGAVFLAAAIIAGALIIRSRPSPITQVTMPAPIVGEFDTVLLPVPVSFVPAGTRMREVTFKQVAFPKHQIPSGALSSLEAIMEAVAIAPLPANLPLFEANLSRTGPRGQNPVIDAIPAGMRAMTIRVDVTSAVEGWAGSGSVVDVLLVEKERTTVVAEQVKVLSAERQVAPIEGTPSPNVPTTVTLLVSQEQCLAINTAIPLGRIAFALRSSRDEQSWQNTVFTAERLKGATAVVAKVPSSINGFVSISGAKGESQFALADGKWVKTDVIPQGFMAAKDRQIMAGE